MPCFAIFPSTHRIASSRSASGTPGTLQRDEGSPYLELRDWQDMPLARSKASVAYDEQTMNVSDEDARRALRGRVRVVELVRLIGQRPFFGRTLQAEDDREGAPSVVVLGWAVVAAQVSGL